MQNGDGENTRIRSLRSVRTARRIRARRGLRNQGSRRRLSPRDGRREERTGGERAGTEDGRRLRLRRLPASRHASRAGRDGYTPRSGQSRTLAVAPGARGEGGACDVCLHWLGLTRACGTARRDSRDQQQARVRLGRVAGSGGEMGRTGAMGRGRQVRDLVGSVRGDRYGACDYRANARDRGGGEGRDRYGVRLASRRRVGSVRENLGPRITRSLFSRSLLRVKEFDCEARGFFGLFHRDEVARTGHDDDPAMSRAGFEPILKRNAIKSIAILTEQNQQRPLACQNVAEAVEIARSVIIRGFHLRRAFEHAFAVTVGPCTVLAVFAQDAAAPRMVRRLLLEIREHHVDAVELAPAFERPLMEVVRPLQPFGRKYNGLGQYGA